MTTRYRPFESKWASGVVPAGSDLYRQGDVCSNYFIVLDGWIALAALLDDGSCQILDFALPGAVLGFQSAANAPMYHSARCLSTVRVFAFPRHKLDNIIEGNPRLAVLLCRQIIADGAEDDPPIATSKAKATFEVSSKRFGSADARPMFQPLQRVVAVQARVGRVEHEREVADDLRRALLDGMRRDDVRQESHGALRQNASDNLGQARLVDERLTEEEVGVDLSGGAAVFLGYMREFRAHTKEIVVVPSVFKLLGSPAVNPNGEVATYEWASLTELAGEASRSSYVIPRSGGQIPFACIVYHSLVIWGLTERILSGIIRS